MTETKKNRTALQNSAEHVYFKRRATAMAAAGFTQRSLILTLKEGFELPITEHMIKDIFRGVGRAMFDKDSTSRLTTIETQEVYRATEQRFAELTGIDVPWPSSEPPIF